MSFFGFRTELSRIAARFPATNPPEGTVLTKQTIQVGMVRYRRCVDVSIEANGLYFQVRMAFRDSPPVLIPWQAIASAEPSRIYGRHARTLFVGIPPVGTVRVPEEIYTGIESFLPATRDRSTVSGKA